MKPSSVADSVADRSVLCRQCRGLEGQVEQMQKDMQALVQADMEALQVLPSCNALAHTQCMLTCYLHIQPAIRTLSIMVCLATIDTTGSLLQGSVSAWSSQ